MLQCIIQVQCAVAGGMFPGAGDDRHFLRFRDAPSVPESHPIPLTCGVSLTLKWSKKDDGLFSVVRCIVY
jgi:hypothetical protein